jgi:arginine/lysine/ornithine decarboxylase
MKSIMGRIFMKIDQSRLPLYLEHIDYVLTEHSVNFDVPGHKHGRSFPDFYKQMMGETALALDINSSKTMDNLSNPIGVIKEAQDLAADLFKADHAYFLVNGSTSGIQNMILASCNPNDKIIMPRNMHKSAINGLVLSGALPIFIYPEIEEQLGISMGMSLENVKKTIDDHLDAKAIMILNPTYYGYTSNIKEITAYAHERGLAVLVDESHGSLFALSDKLPLSGLEVGVDMVTISMHKTGGSLTQSSILFHNEGRISPSRVRSVVNLAQTSSANYILLSSLDVARYQLANHPEMIDELIMLSDYVREEINKIDSLYCPSEELLNQDTIYDFDQAKIVVDVSELGYTGFQVVDLLQEEYNIQLEVGETNVILAIIGLGDTKETVDVLLASLKDFVKSHHKHKKTKYSSVNIHVPITLRTPREAFFSPSTLVELKDAVDQIASDQIMVYPPGIPLAIPGELITKQMVEEFQFLLQMDSQLIGCTIIDEKPYIRIMKEGLK